MMFSQKSKKQLQKEELERLNQLMQKLGRKPVSAKPTRKSKKAIRSTKASIVSIKNDDQYRKPNLPPTSDNVTYSVGKPDFQMEFERGKETKETIDAINVKSQCTAPLYSKGAYQYVTPKTNTNEIGRKI